MRVRATVTVLSKAAPGGESLRTTVPSFIVAQLGFRSGDRLKWELHDEPAGAYIVVRRFIEKRRE